MAARELFVFGSGGHAKVVLDAVERAGVHRVVCVADDAPGRKGTLLAGYPVIGGRPELLAARAERGVAAGVVAIGDNDARRSVAAWLLEQGFELVSVIHPSAQVARSATIGAGSVLFAQSAVNADAAIGCNVILNTRASVDHDCEVGDCVHIAPGATVCGAVRIGAGSRIWAGATIINDITIGADATVGAGAVVVRDVPEGVTVVGVPARPLGASHEKETG